MAGFWRLWQRGLNGNFGRHDTGAFTLMILILWTVKSCISEGYCSWTKGTNYNYDLCDGEHNVTSTESFRVLPLPDNRAQRKLTKAGAVLRRCNFVVTHNIWLKWQQYGFYAHSTTKHSETKRFVSMLKWWILNNGMQVRRLQSLLNFTRLSWKDFS